MKTACWSPERCWQSIGCEGTVGNWCLVRGPFPSAHREECSVMQRPLCSQRNARLAAMPKLLPCPHPTPQRDSCRWVLISHETASLSAPRQPSIQCRRGQGCQRCGLGQALQRHSRASMIYGPWFLRHPTAWGPDLEQITPQFRSN